MALASAARALEESFSLILTLPPLDRWATSVDAVSVSVYRKGFGSYPEYSDGGGSTPTLPVDPLSEGWALVGSVPRNSETMTDLRA